MHLWHTTTLGGLAAGSMVPDYFWFVFSNAILYNILLFNSRGGSSVPRGGKPYQLRWLKNKKVCCVPFCGSADIEVNVHRHNISWGDVCNSISIESVSAPIDCLLSLKH